MQAGIDLYCSKGTAEALGLDGHRLHVIQALGQFTIGTWTILPFDTVHDAREPLGFLMASGDTKILFATDTAYVKYRFRGLTHLLVEANYSLDLLRDNTSEPSLRRSIIQNHMSLQNLESFFAVNDLSAVEEIWLLHLSNANSDAEGFKRRVQEVTGAMVFVAEP